MAKNAADIASKWARNLGTSVNEIKAGVQAVTTSPTAQAAQRADAYLSGVQQAVSSGKWQAGLNRVTLQDWQNAMINKGLNRIAGGATQAQGKFQDFMSQLLPHIEAGQRALSATPRGDLTTNINRAVQFMQHMAAFKRSK